MEIRKPGIFSLREFLISRFKPFGSGGAGLASLVVMVGVAVYGADPPVPDFRLLDMNPDSVRHGSPVSPSDYVLQVSGYYFGAAG